MSEPGPAPAQPERSTAADDLLLRVTPPRVPRDLVVRPHLLADAPHFRDRVVVLVQAPPGFGKTSLLAQWRREHLARGAAVAWLACRSGDPTGRLVQGLVLAVRVGAGRPGFGHTLLAGDAASGAADGPGALEGITTWLAELAQTAMNLVLVIDEADRLAPPAREALAYLLRNAPPNLRAVVGARADCDFGLADLVDCGQCALVGPALLAFQLPQTTALVRQRFGPGVDHDACARLHELTEGWPLGLQLGLSLLAGHPDPAAQVAALAAPAALAASGLRERFVGLLLANLAAADLDFLTRIAVLDDLHPALCQAVTGADDAAARLARLVRDTPVFAGSEAGPWLRMHALAREALRQRLAQLPAAECAALHQRASAWLAGQGAGMLEAAAAHALEAGQHEQALSLAERSLYEAVMSRGRLDTALQWLGRLPPAELDQRPRLLLAAAWSLAVGERHDEAGRLVARMLAQPGADDSLRCECALILSGAAVFADEPDRFAELHDPWCDTPPLASPLLQQVHANRASFRALIEGAPALARRAQQRAPGAGSAPLPGFVGHWGEFVMGLSYLWEGQVRLAEGRLRPALARAETELGRRSPLACMLAALLAAAVWEASRPDEAAALLAHRLDVLERAGLPETVMLAYRTLARMASAAGAEHRALELLDALDAVGAARRLPRLRLASLADQVRLHAHRFRAQSCQALVQRMAELLAAEGLPPGRRWRRSAELLLAVARGHAAIAAQDWRAALAPLGQADAVAQQLKLGRLHIELLGLRALALDQLGEPAAALQAEATDLAATYGLQRVFADAHPLLGPWPRAAATSAPPPAVAPVVPDMAAPRSVPSTALTPKEREVLELLARQLSNKEIGLALQVGEETIKWHMKNLFSKLDAGTRKQVVQRARILGLLQDQG